MKHYRMINLKFFAINVNIWHYFDIKDYLIYFEITFYDTIDNYLSFKLIQFLVYCIDQLYYGYWCYNEENYWLYVNEHGTKNSIDIKFWMKPLHEPKIVSYLHSCPGLIHSCNKTCMHLLQIFLLWFVLYAFIHIQNAFNVFIYMCICY